MEEKLKKAKQLVTECKEMAVKNAEKHAGESDKIMLWLNYRIELADVEYRLNDMISYLPKEK